MSYSKSSSRHNSSKNGSTFSNDPTDFSDGFSIKIPTDVKSHGNIGLFFIVICIVCLFIKWWAFFIAIAVLSMVATMISRSDKAKPLVKKANKLIREEKWSDLIIVISEIKSLYRESKEINAYLGMSHILAGDIQKGTSILEDYLGSGAPEKGNVRVYLANSYYENKQYDKALSHFDKLPAEYKTLLCIQNMIADSYLQTGKAELALTMLENGPMNSKDNDKGRFRIQIYINKSVSKHR